MFLGSYEEYRQRQERSSGFALSSDADKAALADHMHCADSIHQGYGNGGNSTCILHAKYLSMELLSGWISS